MNIGINTDFAGAWELLMEWIWLLLPIFALGTILFAVALVSLIRKKATGMEKLPWFLLIFLVQTFGPIIYFAVGASKLDEKAAARENWRQE